MCSVHMCRIPFDVKNLIICPYTNNRIQHLDKMNDSTCPVLHKLKSLTLNHTDQVTVDTILTDSEIDYIYDAMYDESMNPQTISDMMKCMLVCYGLQTTIVTHYNNQVLSDADIRSPKQFKKMSQNKINLMTKYPYLPISALNYNVDVTDYIPLRIVFIDSKPNNPWIYRKYNGSDITKYLNDSINNYKNLINFAEQHFGG
jgi:hypothetical protein